MCIACVLILCLSLFNGVNPSLRSSRGGVAHARLHQKGFYFFRGDGKKKFRALTRIVDLNILRTVALRTLLSVDGGLDSGAADAEIGKNVKSPIC